jgi:alkylhydroperoxidase family enzyme
MIWTVRSAPVELTNQERAFADRPDVYAAWGQLLGTIRGAMDLRRYELVTLAAARRLRSSYCCLAHGSILRERFEADRQRLRDLGLSDTEIMDVVMAAAVRCFFSKTLDALGVLPDAHYRELEPELREALVVGRPIADA